MILALFDFDGTLTKRDTLLPFTKYAVGNVNFLKGILMLLPKLFLYKLKIYPNNRMKADYIKCFFSGFSEEKLKQCAVEFAHKRLDLMLNLRIFQKFLWHKEQGHRVIIVSASLEIYLIPWAKRYSVEAIGTRLEIKDGIITGNILGKNCYGKEKVRRLKEICNLDMYDIIYAYGDSNGDKEMFEIAHKVYYSK